MTYEQKPTATDQLTYQPHIDGLRAIAILAVIGNHIDLPGFGGGYVGVDVFFVISGYLIITQIVGDVQRRAFSFADFWSRRAFRILPPLLVMLVVSVAIGSYVDVTKQDLFNLGQEALYSTLMAINFLLQAQQGYFDALAETKPFLHIWSLAVEEQFYLLAPLIIVFSAPLFRRWPGLTLPLIAAAFLISLGACVYYSINGPAGVAFYFMPTRAWEFIVGGVIGIVVPRLRQSGLPIGWVGLVLILGSTVLLGPDPNYPSYLALLPVLGAAAIIADGLAFPAGRLATLLSSRPLVWIGLVSYAWYLWHWPLIVFLREYAYGDLGVWGGVGAAAVALLLAWGTRVFVEVPIKRWRQANRTKTALWRGMAASIMAVTIVAGVGMIGIANELSFAAPKSSGGFDMANAPNAADCRLDRTVPELCLRQTSGKRLGVVIGDSIAADLFGDLSDGVQRYGFELAEIATPGCFPLLGFQNPADSRDYCVTGQRTALGTIRDKALPLEFAIIAAHWDNYGSGMSIEHHARTPVAVAGSNEVGVDQAKTISDGLRSTIDFLQASGIRKILVIGPLPDFSPTDRHCAVRAVKNSATDTFCGRNLSDFLAYRQPLVERLNRAISGTSDVRLVDPIGAVCDLYQCPIYADGRLLFC